MSSSLDEVNSKLDNMLIIGDLDPEINEPSLDEFCQTYNLENIVKKQPVLEMLKILHP